jgi:hypothetical protein
MPRTFEEPLGGARIAGKPEITPGKSLFKSDDVPTSSASTRLKPIPPAKSKPEVKPIPIWPKGSQVTPSPNPRSVRLGMLRTDI